MKVVFTRTGKRRYRVSVECAGEPSRHLEPAPGYHDRLPHDVAHFIVEDELGIEGGIFGQMAAGGIIQPVDMDPRQRRKAKKRRIEVAQVNASDALFSEHAVYAAQSRWENHAIIPETKIPQKEIERICARFEKFAAEWSSLPVGGSITLFWERRPSRKRRSR